MPVAICGPKLPVTNQFGRGKFKKSARETFSVARGKFRKKCTWQAKNGRGNFQHQVCHGHKKVPRGKKKHWLFIWNCARCSLAGYKTNLGMNVNHLEGAKRGNGTFNFLYVYFDSSSTKRCYWLYFFITFSYCYWPLAQFCNEVRHV